MDAEWIELSLFAKTAHLDTDSVQALIDNGELEAKEENGTMYVSTNSVGSEAAAMIPQVVKDMTENSGNAMLEPQFVEKTIGTILSLHEKVISSKDETIDTLKHENEFMKESVLSMQELYDDERETIDTLNEQLRMAQDEIKFLKRKYKLMWGKVVDDYAADSE